MLQKQKQTKEKRNKKQETIIQRSQLPPTKKESTHPTPLTSGQTGFGQVAW